MPDKIDQLSTASRKAIHLFGILIFGHKAYTLRQLAEKLNCSRQTILRLIEQIESTHICKIKKWTSDRQNWYQIERNNLPTPLLVTVAEYNQLLLCKEFVHQILPREHQSLLEQATEKVASLVGDGKNQFKTSELYFTKGSIDYTPHEEVLEDIISAYGERRVLDILYWPRSPSYPKIHSFVPGCILVYREGLYIKGWRIAKRGKQILGVMTLALHRILETCPTRLVLHEQDTQAFSLTQEDVFGIVPEKIPFQVRIKFILPASDYICERHWSSGQKIEAFPDGSIILTITAQSDMEVIKWVLSYGKEATLLEPDHLRKRIVEELNYTKERYMCDDSI